MAGIGFAIMGALVKAGASRFSHTELVFYRSAFGFLGIALMVQWQGKPLRTPMLKKQISRAVVGFVSLVLFFYAIAHLPLATAITLNYTSPIFLACLAPWLLPQDGHQHPSHKWLTYACLVLGFVGVVLLLHPIFKAEYWLAGSLGLLSGFGAALAYAHVKQLGLAGEPDWRTVYYFTLLSTVASGIWMLAEGFRKLHWSDLPLLLGLGLSATLAQLAMTRAYRTGHTLTVASLAYSTVVFATLLGVIFWQEHLSAIEYIGIALVVLSGLLSVRANN